MEETRRILQEIDRINLALGYKKRMSYAFPRVTNSETYFYPRQEFRPEFLTKPKQNVRSINNLRAINPFNAQNYYYPTPYLQVPVDGKPHAFKTNKYFYPLIYAPINFAPFANQNNDRDEKSSDGSIKLGTIVVLPKDKFFREPKAAEPSKLSKPVENVKKVKQQQQQQQQEEEETDAEIIEEIVKYELDPFGITGITDDDEDERQEEIKPTTERLPAIKNDKYLNILLKKGQNNDDDEDDEEQARKLKPPPISTNRAINLPNPIEKLQNFTKHFAFQKQEVKPKQTESTQNPSTPSELDIEDEENEQAENKEDEKSPFGFAFGPKQQSQTFKEGGLIIQRLRVRHGGIAIAGPGMKLSIS